MTTKHLVIAPRRFRAEEALAILLANKLNGLAASLPTDTKDAKPLLDSIASSGASEVHLVGTFFAEAARLAKATADIRVRLLYFFDPPVPVDSDVQVEPFALETLFGVPTNAHEEKMISILIDRVKNPKSTATQAFMSGFHNMRNPVTNQKLEMNEVIASVSSGFLTIDEIEKVGALLLQWERDVVRARVAEHAIIFRLKSRPDVRAAAVQATEHYNLCHEELHAMFPEHPLTVVWSLSPKGMASIDFQKKWSIRSYSPHVDAGALARTIDGDGNAEAGGGKTHVSRFDLPF